MTGETYSERIVEDYPKLSRSGVIKLLAQHGFKPDQPTMLLPESERSKAEVTYDNGWSCVWDMNSTFDAEFGVRETYTTGRVMAWLGY